MLNRCRHHRYSNCQIGTQSRVSGASYLIGIVTCILNFPCPLSFQLSLSSFAKVYYKNHWWIFICSFTPLPKQPPTTANDCSQPYFSMGSFHPCSFSSVLPGSHRPSPQPRLVTDSPIDSSPPATFPSCTMRTLPSRVLDGGYWRIGTRLFFTFFLMWARVPPQQASKDEYPFRVGPQG